jgi:dCTP deaminase
MFLSATDIESSIRSGEIRLEPFQPELLKPASYVLRLGSRFARWHSSARRLSPWTEAIDPAQLVYEEAPNGIELAPGDFLLAATMERVSVPRNLVGVMSPLSHIARLGISVVSGSCWISPGFGEAKPTALTLEICSLTRSAVVLHPGMPVCHLAFAETSRPAHNTVRPLDASVYEGRDAPMGPRLLEEFQFAARRGTDE